MVPTQETRQRNHTTTHPRGSARSVSTCKDRCDRFSANQEWQGGPGIGSRAGEARNKGGKITRRQIGAGIDNGVQQHPK
jgi:hypothetical protein